MKTTITVFLVFILIILVGCEREQHYLALVETSPVTGITSNSALSGGIITDYGGTRVLACGVAWDTSPMPWVQDFLTNDSLGTDTFKSRLINLNPETTYYVRAYVTNSEGTTYGKQVIFTTLAEYAPEVFTTDADSISWFTAHAGGSIRNPDQVPIMSRGVCWDTLPDPETSDFLIHSGSEDSLYSCELQNLLPGITYYYRAFITFDGGTVYGEEKEFVTLMTDVPVVTTSNAVSITYSSASSGGVIWKTEQVQILTRGVCWDTLPAPELSDFTAQAGSEDSLYTCELRNLLPGTTYYYRAFITVEGSTIYGDEKQFTTPVKVAPSVTTSDAVSVTYFSAVSGGIIQNTGQVKILIRGVCWDTLPSPELSDYTAQAASEDSLYSCELRNLLPGKLYYYRAFITCESGIVYGEQKVFTTTSLPPPVVETFEATGISAMQAVFHGKVEADDLVGIGDKGFCYGETMNPDLNDMTASAGGEPGSFSSGITDLEPGTTYYIRAYATTCEGVIYGNEAFFTTNDTLPVVTTNKITSLTHESAVAAGLVVSDGGTPVTLRGFCWSVDTEPTLEDQFLESGNGTGMFLEKIGGLDVKTTYFVRAYATNKNGTAYGEELQFTTYDTAQWILVFSDDFEDYVTGEHPSKWTTRFSGDDAAVSEVVAYEGNKSFMLSSRYNWSRVEAFPLDSVPDAIRFEGAVYVDQASKGYSIGFGYKESSNTYRFKNGVGLNNTNLINFIGTDTISWTPQTWYKIEAELDLVTNDAKLWVDGVFIAEVSGQLSPKDEMDDFVICGINFPSGATSKAYYDDVKLYFKNTYSCQICK